MDELYKTNPPNLSSEPAQQTSGSSIQPAPQYLAFDEYPQQPEGSVNDLLLTPVTICATTNKKSIDPTVVQDLETGVSETFPEVDPPEFSVYRASYTTDSLGNIISHDAHLNADGEALCRFILLHTTAPPELFVKLIGTHEEVRIENYTEYVDGRAVNNTRQRHETVTDFSFTVPMVSQPSSEAAVRLIHVVNDGEVVSRGQCRRQASEWGKDLLLLDNTGDHSPWLSPSSRSRAVSVKWQELRAADRVAKEVQRRGLIPFIPPWLFPDGTFSTAPLKPPPELLCPDWESKRAAILQSLTHEGHYFHNPLPQDRSVMEQELRAWCDIYCDSKKQLKQFRVEKRLFGWNLDFIHDELYRSIRAIPHLRSTHIQVDFHSTSSHITIRPVNTISKIFSLGGFYKFLLSIILVYPILWLVRYFFLGAELGVIRAGYPLIYWSRTDRSNEDEPPNFELRGRKDHEWLRDNLESIRQACQAHRVGGI